MAEKTLQKLEDQLNCSICLDTYSTPKMLQCYHTYCQDCLGRLVLKDRLGQLTLTCPNCRHVTPVPASGVAGLQAAFQINQLLEIVGEHKKAKGLGDGASPELATKGEKVDSSIVPQNLCCPDHPGVKRELYCETCEELVCWKCVIKGGKHHCHEYEEICSAYEKYKAEIVSSLEPMEKQLGDLEGAVAEFDASSVEVSAQQAALERNIRSAMSGLRGALDLRETELLSQLNSITQNRLKGLAAQKDQVEATQAQLSTCLLFMREHIEAGDQGEKVQLSKASDRTDHCNTAGCTEAKQTTRCCVFSCS